MASKTSKTGIAKQTNNLPAAPQITRADVPSLIAAIRKELSILEGDDSNEIDLNIKFEANQTNSLMNVPISEISEVGKLILIRCSVKSREAAYNAELAELGLTDRVAPFTVSDKSASEWMKITEKAINLLLNKQEIANRKAAIKELEKHLDEDTKFNQTINSILSNSTALIK